jgi:hypothetical protein
MLGDGLTSHTAASTVPASAAHNNSSSGGVGVGGLGINSLLRHLHLDAHNPTTKYLLSPTDAPQSAAARIAALKYTNFDVNSKQYSTFFLHEYSWKVLQTRASRQRL